MLQPVNTYILVEVVKEEETTKGGLYIPQGTNMNALNILQEGKVLAVSEKVENVEVDQVVYFNKHAMTMLPDDETHVLVRSEDLYAIKK